MQTREFSPKVYGHYEARCIQSPHNWIVVYCDPGEGWRRGGESIIGSNFTEEEAKRLSRSMQTNLNNNRRKLKNFS
jgi:hypothetical protein